MDPLLIGGLSMVLLIVLMLVGMPIAFALWVVGAAGLIYVTNVTSMLTQMQVIAFNWSFNFMIAVIPLFIWMGYIMAESGIIEDLFACFRAWLGWLPGGLGIATSFANAGFGAVSSSAWAAVSLFNRIALPEMRKYGYDKRLASGLICAAGTFAYMIPPSMPLIIVGMLAEISISSLLLAGYIPGFLLALLSGLTALLLCVFLGWGPALKEKYTLKQRIMTLRGVWGVFLIILLIAGGLYGGIFTPTEAAGVGCTGALVITLARRKLTWANFRSGAMRAARTTGMMFAVFIGALLFSRFLVVSGFVDALGEYLLGLELPRIGLLLLFIVMYIFLGMFMSDIVMIVMTVPFVFPVVIAAGFDPVWLGILLLLMIEIAAVTPPVGLTLYVAKGTIPDKDISVVDIFVGAMPFLACMVLLAVLLIFFPQIATFLPNTMMKR